MADLDTYVNAYLVHPFRWAEEWRTVRTEPEAGGLGIRRRKWQAPLYRGELTVIFRTAALANSFLGFFSSKKGSAASFTWTNPRNSTVYTCTFTDDAMREAWEGPERYSYTFALEGKAGT